MPQTVPSVVEIAMPITTFQLAWRDRFKSAPG